MLFSEGEKSPYFLIPQTFSRFDTPLQKMFKRELLPETGDNNLIGNRTGQQAVMSLL